MTKAVRIAAILTLALAAFAQTVTKSPPGAQEATTRDTQAKQGQPLTKQDIADLMSGKVSDARIVSLVEQRGITFEADAAYLQTLKAAGASDEVTKAIYAASLRRKTVPAAPSAAPSSQPAGTKRPPQATSPDEYAAYKAFIAQVNPVTAEQAAKDFDSKFPRSELRALLYYTLMHRYQEANNGAKAVEMGRKAVQLDPDNPVGLMELANLLAEGTREGDFDREQRYAEAAKLVQHGLQRMDSSIVVPPGTPAEKVQQLKQFLTAMARATLGLVDFNHQNYAAAEPNLRQAAQLNLVQPDPMVYLRLAIALDHQGKYAEALQAANKVLELTPNGGLADLAHREKDRLQKLMGISTPAPAVVPAKPATTPPPAPTSPPARPPDKPKG